MAEKPSSWRYSARYTLTKPSAKPRNARVKTKRPASGVALRVNSIFCVGPTVRPAGGTPLPGLFETAIGRSPKPQRTFSARMKSAMEASHVDEPGDQRIKTLEASTGSDAKLRA